MGRSRLKESINDGGKVNAAAVMNEICAVSSKSQIIRRGLVDSGATSVMRQNALNIQSFAPVSTVIRTAAENTVIKATGQGFLVLNVKTDNGDFINIELQEALVVPGISTQLTAVSALVDSGHSVIFTSELSGFYAFGDLSVFVPFVRDGNLWFLEEFESSETAMAATATVLSEWERIHLALVHLNPKYMAIARNNTIGLEHLSSSCPSFPCHICVEGKMRHANKARMSRSKAEEPFELIHVDTAGPYRVEGIGRVRYFTVFTDDMSRYRWVYTHRTKDELPTILRKFLADVGAMRIDGKHYKVCRLRSDNGGEYTGAEFEGILLENLIKHEYSNAHEHFQIGRAERSVGLVSQGARLMHITSNLPKKIWPFAVRHAVYILNRVPTKANQNYMTPYERLKQEKPNLKNLKIFGSLLYGYVHKVQSSDWKMDARGVPMAYIGDGQVDGSKAVIGYKIGKENTGAIVYTTSFWSDPTFLPCRPRSDRRITSCSFGSYPDIEKELTDLYTSPSDDDVIQNMDDSEIKVADLKNLVNESDDQRIKQLLEGLKNQLDAMKSKQRESLQNGGVPDHLDNVESSPEQSLIDLSEIWELIGYDSASDKYFVKINDASRLIDSHEVHERISNGGKVMSSALGLNFEAFDDENETLIVQNDDSEIVSEMDVQAIKDKLREILNSFLSGTISHIAYSKQSQAMTALLSKMKETDGRVLTAAESCATSEMFSVALAVEEFAAVMREHKKKNDEPSMEKLFGQLKERSG